MLHGVGVTRFLRRGNSGENFSFRILPPLGNGNATTLFHAVSDLGSFSPQFVGVAARRDRCICGRLRGNLLAHRHIHHHPNAITVTNTVRGGCSVPIVPRIVYDNTAGRSVRCRLLSLRFLNVDGVLILENSGTGRSQRFAPARGNRSGTASLLGRMGRFGSNFFFSNAPVGRPNSGFYYNMTYCPRGRRRTPGLRVSVRRLLRGRRLNTSCTVARLFCSGRGFCTFMRGTHRVNVAVPVIPTLGPFTGLDRLAVMPGAFRYSVPRTLTRRILGYGDSRSTGTLNVR